MARYKVVVTDHLFSSLEEEREIVGRVGADLVEGQCRCEDEVLSLSSGADAILNTYAPITEKVINALERCRVIVRFGIGVDNVAVDAATRRGIMVANTTDYCIGEVADQAMSFLLAFARGLFPAGKVARDSAWELSRLPTLNRLEGQVLGLIGLGHIGRAVATRARAFGLKILVYDPYVTGEAAQNLGAQLVNLATLLDQADYVSIHVPLKKETQGMIGADAFSKMKRTAYLINVARGKIVDQTALCAALQQKQIAGAGLDVLEIEPPMPDDPVRSLDNVILTPHSAWYSEQSRAEMRRRAVGQVVSVLKGELPYSLVNREVVERTQRK